MTYFLPHIVPWLRKRLNPDFSVAAVRSQAHLPSCASQQLYKGPSRTRIDLSKEQVDILEHAWEQGLTSASKKHNQEIGDLSIKTSISRERIEVWIGNRRAKQKRGGQGVAPTKKRKTTKGPTAYTLFSRQFKRGKYLSFIIIVLANHDS
ncbi:Hypothetical predicted protein [Mytilus galloprovincialis]|uniref:Homeobox domain-containing protein n=1 Tax=Mytilus galloprovincialis TaxID=29158 RepID=A0A8B6CEK5_MYTGA|nr:Hypothetical predicted protein [Mytilus galloprovincialis]